MKVELFQPVEQLDRGDHCHVHAWHQKMKFLQQMWRVSQQQQIQQSQVKTLQVGSSKVVANSENLLLIRIFM